MFKNRPFDIRPFGSLLHWFPFCFTSVRLSLGITGQVCPPSVLGWHLALKNIHKFNIFYLINYIVTWFLIPISNPNLFFNCCCFHQHYLVDSKVHEQFRIAERDLVKPCAEQFRCTYILSGQDSASCVQFWNLASVPKILKKTRTMIYLYKFDRQFLERYLIIKIVNSFLSTLNTLLGTGCEWPKDKALLLTIVLYLEN